MIQSTICNLINKLLKEKKHLTINITIVKVLSFEKFYLELSYEIYHRSMIDNKFDVKKKEKKR